jgi:hypothetical protein
LNKEDEEDSCVARVKAIIARISSTQTKRMTALQQFHDQTMVQERPRFKNIDEIALHHEEQDGPKVSTLHGIGIERMLEDEKAKDSIGVNLESRSNKIE